MIVDIPYSVPNIQPFNGVADLLNKHVMRHIVLIVKPALIMENSCGWSR